MQTNDKRNTSTLIQKTIFNDRTDEVFRDTQLPTRYSVKEKLHLQKLLKRIHSRIEQKFTNYRHAFRAFDVNLDGQLNLEEFVECCEKQGILLPISDFQKVFKMIDYDGSGGIGYKEFCLLNSDKRNIFAHIEMIKDREMAKEAALRKEKVHGKAEWIRSLTRKIRSVSSHTFNNNFIFTSIFNYLIKNINYIKTNTIIIYYFNFYKNAQGGQDDNQIIRDLSQEEVVETTKESDMLTKIRNKQMDKPKPYAVAENGLADDEANIPKKNDINQFQSDV